MTYEIPQAHLPVDDIMRRWPRTIRVFLELKLACVGCPIGVFHTVDDAAAEHGLDRDDVLGRLRTLARPETVDG
jgi:hybrid cluster-associated redox disulfide protein